MKLRVTLCLFCYILVAWYNGEIMSKIKVMLAKIGLFLLWCIPVGFWIYQCIQDIDFLIFNLFVIGFFGFFFLIYILDKCIENNS